MTERSSFIPQPHYDKAELVACGLGELFGPGNAQLPIDNMLMIDRVTHISSEGERAAGKGELIAELDIHPDLWFFGCHFPWRPGDARMSRPGRHVATGRDFFLDGVAIPGRGRALGSGEVKFSWANSAQATRWCDTTSR